MLGMYESSTSDYMRVHVLTKLPTTALSLSDKDTNCKHAHVWSMVGAVLYMIRLVYYSLNDSWSIINYRVFVCIIIIIILHR